MRRTAGLGGRAGRLISGKEGGREGRRGEGEEVEGYEEKLIECADREEHVLSIHGNQHVGSRVTAHCADEVDGYLVRIVKVEQLRPILVDFFVTHPSPGHGQRSIHVHIMARQIQADEPLEQ